MLNLLCCVCWTAFAVLHNCVAFAVLYLHCCICCVAFVVLHLLCCIYSVVFAVLDLLCCICCVAFAVLRLIKSDTHAPKIDERVKYAHNTCMYYDNSTCIMSHKALVP